MENLNLNNNVSLEFDIEEWKAFVLKKISIDSISTKVLIMVTLISFHTLGAVANALCAIVIFRDKTMHTVTNCYLLNLAISDILFIFGSVIQTSVLFLPGRLKQIKTIGSTTHVYLGILLSFNSMFTMTALAVERYIVIWHPLLRKSKSCSKRVLKVIILIWILSILVSVPEFLCLNEIGAIENSAIWLTVTSKYARIVCVFDFIVFMLSLIIMAYTCMMIAFKVKDSEVKKSKRKSDQVFNHRENSRRVNNLLVAVTFSFFMFWAPFLCVRVIFCYLNSKQLISFVNWLGPLVFVLTYNSLLSGILNPLLFNLMSSKFRKSFKSLYVTMM